MTYAIGTPLNEVEVAALCTLFPQLSFTLMNSCTSYLAEASSEAERQAVWSALTFCRTTTTVDPVPAVSADPVPFKLADNSCEMCGTLEGTTYYPQPDGRVGEYLCVKHSQSRALTNAAHDHLVSLFRAAVREWVLHWGQAMASVEDIADAIDWAVAGFNSETSEVRFAYIRFILESATPPIQKVD
ncbi:hypothetical protein [Deinococcus sp. QL22]|uniref:hypothetical protein n=1 Tax=Deinococcus sp. QL22 TaxID=2939437 RepID=UPI002017D9A8|nr:hypothetical protein [Deinococcus sp. QL22]UQN10830.1 hypothetical protein M1R55_31675 [Deinococcus sp. QL22]